MVKSFGNQIKSRPVSSKKVFLIVPWKFLKKLFLRPAEIGHYVTHQFC
jgi:hypothetical protein